MARRGAWREVPRNVSETARPGTAGYEPLVVERRGPVGWLVFDRPDRGNAMDAR